MPVQGQFFQNPGGASGFYEHQIQQSVRFEEDVADTLTRTPSSGGNRKTFAISFWFKRTVITHSGGHMVIFGADPADSINYFQLRFANDDTFRMESSGSFRRITNAVFRDTTSWYHFYVGVDTTAGSGSEFLLYVNGIQITDFSFTAGPSASFDTQVNHTVEHQLGELAYASTTKLAGYLAEFYLIDGNRYAHTDFGEFKNGVWIPKDASGLTFGTNGIHLKFENASDLGNDSSGNNNDYTANNMGADHQVLDSPTFGS
tara:strand:- start:1489 stop:2265 length:777 start_codon:yes stop_codon:yes gene_type:complete